MHSGIFDITEFGAVASGTALCTGAIQSAVDAAAKAGGGRVVVPAGTFLTGTINLKSFVTLELMPGSVLLGSKNLDDYQHIGWGWAHDDRRCDVTAWHLIQAIDAERVAITGEGTISGSGPGFWHPERKSEWHFWVHKENQRPSPMVHIENCRFVRIENVKLQESAGWTLHCHNCEQVTIRGIIVRNTYFGPNTDGIDVSNCRGVTISGCDIETGDDAIALMSSGYGGPSEDIAINNCVLRTSCVGLRIIGFDQRARHCRISASNLVIPRCSRMFDFQAGSGSEIEHVSISGCVGSTNSGWPFNRPVEFATDWGHNPHGDKSLSDKKPSLIRDIHLSDLDVETDGRILILTTPPNRIEDVTLTDVRLRYCMLDDPGVEIPQKRARAWLSGNPEARGARAAIVAANCTRLTLRNFAIRWPEYPVPDRWFLLKSDQRLAISESVYAEKEDQIRTGEIRPVFKAFWGKNLVDSEIDLGKIPDSP